MEPDEKHPRLIESSEISLEYQDFRLKDGPGEKALLASIAERGIEYPVWGIERTMSEGTQFVLMDGFKRIRCAAKLGIRIIPWRSIGVDEAQGLFCLLAISNARGLHILEQAKIVDALHAKFNLGISEIAKRLERSSAWVSIRVGVLSQMNLDIREEIFSGRFPARSYLYTLRHFTRVKGTPPKDIQAFVKSTSGRGLSGRQIDLLASGFFNGPKELRKQIEEGKIPAALAAVQEASKVVPSDLNEFERTVIRDLEISVGAGGRVALKSSSQRLVNSNFYAQAEILIHNWQRLLPDLSQSLEKLYDRCREKKNSVSSSRGGSRQEGDRPTAEARP